MKVKITTTTLKKNLPTTKTTLNNQKVESIQIQKKTVTEIKFI